MRAEQYLGQIKTLKRRIDCLQRDAILWRTRAESISPKMDDGEHVQTTAIQDKMADAITKAVDCEQESLELMTRLIDVQYTIISQINQLDAPDHSIVLNEFYVHEMSIPEIADEWGKSCRSIKRVKSDALEEFSRKFIEIL